MDRRSNKKVNKSALNLKSKKQNDHHLPVQCIMKEIGELKKQLVSIKSKKSLLIGKSIQNEARPNKENTDAIPQQQQQKQRLSHTIKNKPPEPIPIPLHINFHQIQNPRSRQQKLKLSIQQNKLKSLIQKFPHQFSTYSSSSSSQTQYQFVPQILNNYLQTIIAELNTTFVYIDSMFKDYEDKIVRRKEEERRMKEEVEELSEKVLKLVEVRDWGREKGEQVGELRRHLNYYISLMKDTKQECIKQTKQHIDLTTYTNQLQHNITKIRKELNEKTMNLEQIQKNHTSITNENQKLKKQQILMQQNMHAIKLQSQRHKDKRKQIQKQLQNVHDQKIVLQDKLNIRDRDVARLEASISELMRVVEQLKKEEKGMAIGATNKQLQIDKLDRQLTILQIQMTQKQQLQEQQQTQIQQLKLKAQSYQKENKKLTQSLQYCQMQINNLSQQIDQLRIANQRYKNQHFRNKLIQSNSQSSFTRGNASCGRNDDGNCEGYGTFRTMGIQEVGQTEKKRNIGEGDIKGVVHNLHSKNRKRILGEIQELIERHRKSSDSQSEGN